MDRSVAPGDDFFRYANGTWMKTTEIPADRPAFGPDAVLAELTTTRTADLIKEAAASAPAGSDARKVGDYYAAYLDEAAIEAKGLGPLQPTLDRIAAIADRKDLARYLGGTLRADVDALNATDMYTDNVLGVWVAQDLNEPSRYLPFLMQGGLDMPDRAYYVEDSARMEEIRGKLKEHVASIHDVVDRQIDLRDRRSARSAARVLRRVGDTDGRAGPHRATRGRAANDEIGSDPDEDRSHVVGLAGLDDRTEAVGLYDDVVRAS